MNVLLKYKVHKTRISLAWDHALSLLTLYVSRAKEARKQKKKIIITITPDLRLGSPQCLTPFPGKHDMARLFITLTFKSLDELLWCFHTHHEWNVFARTFLFYYQFLDFGFSRENELFSLGILQKETGFCSFFIWAGVWWGSYIDELLHDASKHSPNSPEVNKWTLIPMKGGSKFSLYGVRFRDCLSWKGVLLQWIGCPKKILSILRNLRKALVTHAFSHGLASNASERNFEGFQWKSITSGAYYQLLPWLHLETCITLKPSANGRNIVGLQQLTLLGVVASVYCTWLKVWQGFNNYDTQHHVTGCTNARNM